MLALLLFVLTAALPATAHAALSAQDKATALASGRVGTEVLDGLSKGDRIRVLVAFDLGSNRSAAALEPAQRKAAVAKARSAVLASLPAGALDVRHAFDHVNAVAGEINAAGLAALVAHPAVLRVDVDAPGRAGLSQALPLMNVDDVKAVPATGAGVTAAVIDSGIDTNHGDLADSLTAEACFCSGGGGCCPGAVPTASGPGSAEDNNGHGTNVAGIITGNGSFAPEGGAPDTDIVAVKVLAANGSFCCSSDVVAALDYILDDHPEVRVVNMSLGTNALFTGNCDTAAAFTIAFAVAINTLRARGTTTFVSTGNQASATQLSAPACVAGAIAVGAVWDSNLGSRTFLGCTDSTTAADKVTCFTNSGSNMDLVAAGAFTTSTGNTGSSSTYAGTSQASPAVAACAADLLEVAPTLTPDQLEAALEASPTVVVDAKNGLSFPRLDCLAAYNLVSATTTTTSTTTSSTTTTTTSTTTTTLATGPACDTTPAASCRTPGPRGAFLLLTRSDNPRRNRLKWKLRRGPATDFARLLDPATDASTQYRLCVYDASARPQPLLAASVQGSGDCDGRPCWRSNGTSKARYKNRRRNADGVSVVRLATGVEGRTAAYLLAGGHKLPTTGLPLAFPVTVQLVGERGGSRICFQSAFLEAGHNDPAKLKTVGP